MAISSFVAGKFIGEYTGWQVNRSRLHKLLFITQMVYAYRNNGKMLIDNEAFVASCRGPVLNQLDKKVECYGARCYKNLFRGFDIEWNVYGEELSAIKECLDAYEDSDTSNLASACYGSAWSYAYNPDYVVDIPFFKD